MGILATGLALSALALAACYSPDLRDCTIMCNSESDCVADQVCGSDHFCAAPDLAGQCSPLPPDGGRRDAGFSDASLPDARPDAPRDALIDAVLSISIAGKGQVSMLAVGSCSTDEPQHGSCTFTVPKNALVTAQATASPGWRFERWTSPPCSNTPIAFCTFVAHDGTTVAVKFKKEHDD